MENLDVRQDLIAENTEKAKEKLVDMMYSALVRMSYYIYKEISDCVDENGFMDAKRSEQFKSEGEAYKGFFYVLLSVCGKIQNTGQNIDLNQLIKDEIENYNFDSLCNDSGIKNFINNFNYKEETKNIIENKMFDRKMDVELYTDNMHKSTMPTFIFGKENWAVKNLRAILNDDTVEIEKINSSYFDKDEYNDEYVAANERYDAEITEVVNNVIERYNSLFHDSNGKIIQKNAGEAFITQKYMNCVPKFDLSILNTLINNAEEIKKENGVDKEIVDKMSLVSKRTSTLRDCIVLEDLKAKFNDINSVVNNAVAVINESVENQISNIVIKVGNVDQNAPFKRTLFLINSRCSNELRGNVLSKLNNPDRDCINKFINNEAWHKFINENPDKVETLMWGFVNQPKIFFNDTVTYDTKIKIFDSQRNSPKESYNIYGKSVVAQKISELPAEYSNLVVMIWDRANVFNCNKIVEQLTQQLLAELYGVVKKFDLNLEETKKIVDYFYRHRAEFFNRSLDNPVAPIEELVEVCQNRWGFLTLEQKEIINSRPEEERAKFREAMKDPRFREICVDKTAAKNLSCFLDDYQKYVDDTWFDSIIVILDEFDFGEDFYKGIQETDKKNYLRDIILFTYNKMMQAVRSNPGIYEGFGNNRDYQIALVKDLKNSLSKLREYMKEAAKKGIEGGDAAEQLNLSNDFLPGIDKNNKEAIYVVAQNISSMIHGLENFRKSLSKPEEFNDEEKGIKKIYRNVKYYPKEVANCFVNLSADNEYIENVIENMKKNTEAYKTFKDEVIKQLGNVKENFSDKMLLLSKLYDSSDIKERYTSLCKDIVLYINQNQELNEAKAIVKNILNLSYNDEINKEIKKYVLKKISQDLVDEILIEKSKDAIQKMAQAIVDNKAKIDAPNKILAKAIAKAIIQNHYENAVEVAQNSNVSILIRTALMRNHEIARLVDQQQEHPLDRVRCKQPILVMDGGR